MSELGAGQERGRKRAPGFFELLIFATLVALLAGFGLASWRMTQRVAWAGQADAQLARWGAAARLYAAEHGGLWPAVDRQESRPSWKDVEEGKELWFNVLPPYQGELPVAAWGERASQEWSGQQLANPEHLMDGSAMLRPPAAEYSEPERWAKGPIFGWAWNAGLGSALDLQMKPGEAGARGERARVLVFESLTHRGDRAGHERAEGRDVGRCLGGAEIAADRYRQGTGAVLEDGSLRRGPVAELPW